MSFSPQALADTLPSLADNATCWVALSGGLDSTVLLHACHALKISQGTQWQLRALHVNHGLNSSADAWQTHCQQVCSALSVPLDCHRLQILPLPGESLEQAARRQRYQTLAAPLQSQDCVLLAHHQDDQSETLLYRLLRGSGPKGLGGMPGERVLGKGRLSRPLLAFSRQQILDYAQRHNLVWVEDDSNAHLQHDRNYLRHQVLPTIAKRWPGHARTLARSAQWCREAGALLEEVAREDLQACLSDQVNRLDLRPMTHLSEARQRNLLKTWLEDLHQAQGLPLPDSRLLLQASRQGLGAGPGRHFCLQWSCLDARAELRRYRHWLYALALEPGPSPRPLIWPQASQHLYLGKGLGWLRQVPVQSRGVPLARLQGLQVLFGPVEETLRPAGRDRKPFRKLCQDYGIPPWQRQVLPRLVVASEVVGLGDFFLCQDWQQEEGESLLRFYWERPIIRCG